MFLALSKLINAITYPLGVFEPQVENHCFAWVFLFFFSILHFLFSWKIIKILFLQKADENFKALCGKNKFHMYMMPEFKVDYLQNNHPDKKDRDCNYFKRLGENAKKQLDKTEKQYQQSVGIVTASYEIAVLVAKNKKPHTIAEELIMPAAKVLVKHVIGDEAVSKLNSVSVSNNTIQLRITEMSTDIKEQVITEVQGSKDGFTIQLVESTDVSNYAQLLVYMRYTTKDAIRSELLLINEMRTTTKGKACSSLLITF